MTDQIDFDPIDMRAIWRGEEPDEETKRRIKAVFHTPDRPRIIWDAIYRVAADERQADIDDPASRAE